MAEDAAAQEQSGSNRAPLLVIFLFVVIVILITVIVSMYISYSLTTMVANRPAQEQYVFEEEQKTEAYIPFEGETKGSGIMAYIRTGAEQTSLTVKIDLSVGVSKLGLQPILQVNIAPLQDRVLAYFSDKTKEDVIYLFQRKVLGEELKEILNAILEKDLQVPKTSGRITSVHVTTLTFQSL